MKNLCIFLCLLAFPVFAETNEIVWLGDYKDRPDRRSYVLLDEPQMEGATATITFKNTQVHQGHSTFQLTWNNVTVSVVLQKDVDNWTPEAITVTPLSNHFADPERIVVLEDDVGYIHLFDNSLLAF